MYSDLDSISIPVPLFIYFDVSSEDESSTSTIGSSSKVTDFEGTLSLAQVFSQLELNGLIRVLNLSRKSVELCVSKQAVNNLLQLGTKIAYYSKKEIDLLPFFSREKEFNFCQDILGLLMKMDMRKYVLNKWCLFIDSYGLKGMLLDKGNKYGSILIGHSTKMTEE